MPKQTRWEIEQARRIAQLNKDINTLKERAKELVPEIYASFCIVLKKAEWTDEQIEDLFAATQDVLNEYAENTSSMVEKAEQETGICLRSPEYVGED